MMQIPLEHTGFRHADSKAHSCSCKRPLVSLEQRHRLRPCPGKARCKNQELLTRMPEIKISGTPYWQHGRMPDFF